MRHHSGRQPLPQIVNEVDVVKPDRDLPRLPGRAVTDSAGFGDRGGGLDSCRRRTAPVSANR
jgi:hypothetical protein